MTTTEQALAEAPNELELAEKARRERLPIPSHNGLLHPDRWAMFGRIANTVSDTEFVPRGLRGNAPAVMACLLYGDAQGLHPSVALTEIHIVDGKPTMSATLMVGKIRMATDPATGKTMGHKLRREEIWEDVDGVKTFVGTIAHGIRGDDGETDSFRFDLRMAMRAGLMTKHNWKSYPEAMCWARCVSQLARMLFPDVFLGQSAYTGEELGLEDTTDDGVPEVDAKPLPAQLEAAPGEPEAEPPAPEPEPVVTPGQRDHEPGCNGAIDHEGPCVVILDVRDEDGTLVGSYTKGNDPFEALGLDADAYEIIAAIEHAPGGIVIREKAEPVVGEVTHHPEEEPNAEAETADDGAATETGEEAGTPAGGTGGADPGAGGAEGTGGDTETPPAPGAQAQIASLTIPKVMEAVAAAKERGDKAFILGVLHYEETKAQPRVRLVTTLQETIAELERAEREAAGDAAALAEHEAELEAELRRMGTPTTEDDEPVAEVAPPAAETPPAFTPGGPTAIAPPPEPPKRVAVLKVRAACAWMEEHHPEETAWRYEAIVAAAAHIYGRMHDGPIHSLEELTDEELEQIWNACPDNAREALAILDPADLEQIGKNTLGGGR